MIAKEKNLGSTNGLACQRTNSVNNLLRSVDNHSFLPEKVKKDRDFDNNGECDKELKKR